ncbi:MAG: hypothetical protein H6534_08250 [Chthonomonadaceae bacterium]|nr:hypothetical protein [Chthonomonadaceae bacterium]
MKVLAAVLGLLVAASCWAQSPTDAILVGDKGYIPLPPELVCEPTVKDAQWSPEGRSVLAIRTRILATPVQLQKLLEARTPSAQPEMEETIVLWSAIRRTSQEIFKLPSHQGTVEGVGWFGGSDVGFAIVRYHEGPTPWALYRIAASPGQMKPIATGEQGEIWIPSPRASLGLALHMARPGRELAANTIQGRVIDSDGHIVATFSTPGFGATSWSSDGKRVYWRAFEAARAAGAPPTPVRVHYNALDLRTGAITRIDKPNDIYEEPKPLLQLGAVTLSGPKVTPSPRALLLSGEGPEGGQALITGDFQWLAKLSPANDGVLYKSNDALFVRPLLQLGADQLRELRAAAERAEVLSRGKQCALALIMYASDYDDVFPPAGDISSQIMPYLKNADLLQGFSYTYKGGPMKDIEQPAQTELGFVQGNGGRAILYADGHVVWKKD